MGVGGRVGGWGRAVDRAGAGLVLGRSPWLRLHRGQAQPIGWLPQPVPLLGQLSPPVLPGSRVPERGSQKCRPFSSAPSTHTPNHGLPSTSTLGKAKLTGRAMGQGADPGPGSPRGAQPWRASQAGWARPRMTPCGGGQPAGCEEPTGGGQRGPICSVPQTRPHSGGGGHSHGFRVGCLLPLGVQRLWLARGEGAKASGRWSPAWGPGRQRPLPGPSPAWLPWPLASRLWRSRRPVSELSSGISWPGYPPCPRRPQVPQQPGPAKALFGLCCPDPSCSVSRGLCLTAPGAGPSPLAQVSRTGPGHLLCMR